MEPQGERGIRITWSRPKIADSAGTGALSYLLITQTAVPEALVAAVAVVMLRCIRIRRTV
ncbi:hypothetical protein ACFY7V_03720 [[Kitasatospora] papulosa]|uniref:hypothetical protein n=1 Tax=Streptomyces TaxID=1883 RepID=UPI002FF153D0